MVILTSIGKSIVGSVIAAIAMPICLLILSVTIPNVTLYQGESLPVLTYINWLLFLDPESYSNFYNILGVFATWAIVWLIMGNWSGKISNAALTTILTLVLYFSALKWYYNVMLDLSNYLTWVVMILGFICSSIGGLLQHLRPQKTFFQRLAESGIHIDPEYVKSVTLPIACPKCGTFIFSNAKYCWNCATNLKEHSSKNMN